MDSLTINLNAHKIEYLASTGYLFDVYRDGNDNYTDGDKTILTINGDGEISTTGLYIANAGEGGKIIINGGKHITSGFTLYKSTGGKIEINAGEFESTEPNIELYGLLGGNKANITVRGGKYLEWNPEDFVHEDYMTIYRNNYFEVGLPKSENAGSNSDMKDALNDPFVTEINITGNIKTNNTDKTSNTYLEGIKVKQSVTIKGDGKKTIAAGGREDVNGKKIMNFAIHVDGPYDVILEDLYLTRAGIAASGGATITVKNCRIDHSPGGTSRYAFYVEGGKITIDENCIINNSQKTSHGFIYAPMGEVIILGGTWGGTYIPNTPFARGNDGYIIIKGGTFSVNPTNYLAEGYTAEKIGSNWVVSLDPNSSSEN